MALITGSRALKKKHFLLQADRKTLSTWEVVTFRNCHIQDGLAFQRHITRSFSHLDIVQSQGQKQEIDYKAAVNSNNMTGTILEAFIYDIYTTYIYGIYTTYVV